MNTQIFREYDIRGVAETDLADEVVFGIGRAFASVVRESAGTSHDRLRVVVGRDARVSSPRLTDTLVQGIRAAGVDVARCGLIPTPCLYHAIRDLDAAGGVMVTGSHNPANMNGFKLCLGTASIYGDAIQALRRRIETHEFTEGQGAVSTVDAETPYLRALTDRIQLRRPLRVVLDAGNGAGGPLAERFFRALGVDLIPLYCEPDGTFPNHPADPTVLANLQDLIDKVRETGADVGIGLDGDADRVGVVDDRGRVVYGDRLLALYAREVLAKCEGGTPVIFEVKCSQALIEDLERHGGTPVMWKTGHSLIKSKMKETGSLLAGEMSGHMFFADEYFGYDDGIYAGGRTLRMIALEDGPFSAKVDTVPEYPTTPEIRVPCADDRKFDVVKEVLTHFRERNEVNDIDGARIAFDGGWGLVRASNTQPVLVLRFEGRTPSVLKTIAEEVLDFLRNLPGADVSEVRV